MPATGFPEYAQSVEALLNTVIAAGEATLVNIHIDRRSLLRGLIAGLLQFNDGSELHFREFVDTSQPEPRLMYAYHYQDVNRNLVFRYDNASHRPPPSRQEHKHTPSSVEASPAPTIGEVLDEILGSLKQHRA